MTQVLSNVRAQAAAPARILCAHCGATCPDESIATDGHPFCCHGCRAVYELLQQSGLGRFYTLETTPGIRLNNAIPPVGRFAFLDAAGMRERLADFAGGTATRITFHVPAIHCLACVWLLENLFRLNPAIGQAQVNFPRKEVALSFDHRRLPLSGLVGLLASLGYEPDLNLGSARADRTAAPAERALWLKIGIAGFASANIMMISFSSYFGLELGDSLRVAYGWLSFGLSVPVLLYCSADYFRQSWMGLRRGLLTIDVPIAVGILALFGQSTFDVATRAGEGYFDSFTGLIFLLLCGRWFQQRSFDALAFDRDYRSYFPLSVRRREAGGDRAVPVTSLQVGDRIVVRHREIVPADSRLLSDEAHLDYSFVTGESEPVIRRAGDVIFAGGRQVGAAIELETIKETSQGYLTSLWNHEAFRKTRDRSLYSLTNRMGRWFTPVVLALATLAALAWAGSDPARAVRSFVATLIVACPCALALAAPFALGSALRRFGRHRLFLKDAGTVEQLARVDTVLLDKTGTLTRAGEVRFEGPPLDADELGAIRAVAAHSTHPLSRSIAGHGNDVWPDVAGFSEEPGRGVSGRASRHQVFLGSAAWLRGQGVAGVADSLPAGAAVALDGHFRGVYTPAPAYRGDIGALVQRLATRFRLAVLSGDSDREETQLRGWFGPAADLRFNQKPADKLEDVRRRQAGGAVVLMLGDGLNDAGALRQADVGVAVTDDISSFSPACDAILDAGRLQSLPALLRYARGTMVVIQASFALSFVYNVAGLVFAMRGELSPLVSAILMPVSSVTVVAFALAAGRVAAWRSGLAET